MTRSQRHLREVQGYDSSGRYDIQSRTIVARDETPVLTRASQTIETRA
jgi:hypothetical protein